MFRDRTVQILRSERRLEDRYVLSGFLIVGCILAFAFASNGRWGRLFAVALEGVTLLIILRASQVNPRTIRIVAVFSGLAVIGVVFAAAFDGPIARAVPGVLGAALAIGAPVAIVRRLTQQDTIAFTTVAGSLCVYLLAGLFFALLFWTIGEFDHNHFFAQRTTTSRTGFDYVYFSFVTLTTVGYGDLTARANFGRVCAVFEALFGQLYLVSVVALVVSNVGRARRTTPTK